MKKAILLSVLVLFLASSVTALEIGGVTLPDTLKAGDTELLLNGAGLRKKFGFKVYAAGLYLTKKDTDNKSILEADAPMAIKKIWLRTAGEDKLNSVFFKSFAQVVNAPETKKYTAESDYGPATKDIVTFMSWVSAKPTGKGHVWTYIYTPGKGTDVYVSDGTKEEFKGTIEGIEFKKALFSIWIADKQAVGKKLKKNMLGIK